jgi:Ca2+-binding RTX toxin-like protein
MRRRAILLITVMAAALPLASGVVIAATVVTCQSGSTSTNPCRGTNSDDIITGTAKNTDTGETGDDYIIGGPTMLGYGDDIIYGRSGNDKLYGGYGDDQIYGEEGDDTMDGGYNRDTLEGGDGNDKIYGYYNRDKIKGGKGTDEIYGGNDADDIDAVDGVKDTKIDCGSGTDTLKADKESDGTPIDQPEPNCEPSNITWEKYVEPDGEPAPAP